MPTKLTPNRSFFSAVAYCSVNAILDDNWACENVGSCPGGG